MSALLNSYSESNQSATKAIYSGNWVKFAQSFSSGAGGTLDICKFYLKSTGSPTGNATAVLYAHTNTFGSNGIPTGAALATSDNFDVSTLTSSYGLVTFTFSGLNKYAFSASTNYFISFEYSGGDLNNRVDIGTDTTSPTHEGNRAGYVSGWSANSAEDICFYVYIDSNGQVIIINS